MSRLDGRMPRCGWIRSHPNRDGVLPIRVVLDGGQDLFRVIGEDVPRVLRNPLLHGRVQTANGWLDLPRSPRGWRCSPIT